MRPCVIKKTTRYRCELPVLVVFRFWIYKTSRVREPLWCGFLDDCAAQTGRVVLTRRGRLLADAVVRALTD